MAEQNEGLNRIVSSGVLVAIQREIDFCNESEDGSVDETEDKTFRFEYRGKDYAMILMELPKIEIKTGGEKDD